MMTTIVLQPNSSVHSANKPPGFTGSPFLKEEGVEAPLSSEEKSVSKQKQMALKKMLDTAAACQEWRANNRGVIPLESQHLFDENRKARIEYGRLCTKEEAKICKVAKVTDLATNEEFVDLRVPLDVFKRIREAIEAGFSDEEQFALAADGKLYARTLSVLFDLRKID